MENKVIRCQDGYNKFVFTVKQQLMYAEKGRADPIRCPSCRARKKKIGPTTEDYKKMMQGATMRMYSRHGRGFFRKLGK